MNKHDQNKLNQLYSEAVEVDTWQSPKRFKAELQDLLRRYPNIDIMEVLKNDPDVTKPLPVKKSTYKHPMPQGRSHDDYTHSGWTGV